jgi:hypothetical protein
MWPFPSKTQELIDRLPCKLCIIDADGFIIRSNEKFKSKFFGVTNILKYIVSINYESYKSLCTYMSSSDANTWHCVIEVNIQGQETPLSYLNMSKRLGSMIRRASMSQASTANMTAYKLTVSPFKKNRYVCDFIDVTEEVRNEKLLAKIAQTQAELISSIYPKHIVDSLHQSDVINMIARNHDSVTIMFADIVGFTDMSKHVHPSKVMNFLNRLFSSINFYRKNYD